MGWGSNVLSCGVTLTAETWASQLEAAWLLISSESFSIHCFFLSLSLDSCSGLHNILWKGLFLHLWGLCFLGGGLIQNTIASNIWFYLWNGSFPAERRKIKYVASIIGSCYSCPHLGCISMVSDLCGVFVYAVHFVAESVGSSGKNGGH